MPGTRLHVHSLMLCLCIIVLGACGDSKKASEGSSTDTSQSVVLATVGEKTITSADLEAYLAIKRITVRDEAQLDAVLAELTEREALAQAALATSALDAAKVEAELDEFRREMLISRYFDHHLRTGVTREGVERYYAEHAAEYETKRVKVAHILVRLSTQSSEEEKKAQRAKIDTAYEKLESGTPFEEVAQTFSEDRVSANRGGDMGYIKEGAIAPKFSEIAFGLDQGKFSAPVETGFGYHIIKVLEPVKTQKQPLESVEGDIRYKLRGEAKQAETKRLLETVPVNVDRKGWTPAAQPVTASRTPSTAAAELAAPREVVKP